MFNKPGSLSWLAKHEFRLAWLDFTRMMGFGSKKRRVFVGLFILFAFFLVHLITYSFLWPSRSLFGGQDKSVLLGITGFIVMTLCLMFSQAMEQVTRVFYTRSDLDLILSSPVSDQKVFMVRIATIAVFSSFMSILIFGSVANVLTFMDGPHWLAAYPVLLVLGFLSATVSLIVVMLLFKLIGPRRTRVISQILAAVVGAGFIIIFQVAAFTSSGNMSRMAAFTSDTMLAQTPDINSPVWLPAKAVMGQTIPLLILVGILVCCLLCVYQILAKRMGKWVLLAAGISQSATGEKKNSRKEFTVRSIRSSLRHKEWKLLCRDPWLISQTLMQVFYLIPPAILLWQGIGSSNVLGIVGLPVLVMAAGQLAGGLAWLAISGEDAPQLVQTAPLAKGIIIRGKIEAVLGAVLIIVSPIVLMIGFFDFKLMIIAVFGVASASLSATMIQLWFRTQANRASFRKRQTSSKVATFAEAFSSILWAATAGILASKLWFLSPATILLALLILWIARSFRPLQEF